jgi:hypothetical protein
VTHSLIVEVDQSGKLEAPHDTILAYSNDHCYAILITARVKRTVIGQLRARGLSRSRAAIRAFAAALWLLLRDEIADMMRVTIDPEYVGHEASIKAELIQLTVDAGLEIDPYVIQFNRIGKKSGAHKQAIAIYRGERLADRVIAINDLLDVLRKKK